MKVYLICFFSITSLLFGTEFRLKERLIKAKVGDYIVTEANQLITLLCIRANSPSSLILEEISAPTQNLKKRPSSWPEWVKNRAPGATSWSMIEIDLETGEVLECYSFTRSAWMHLSQKESLIATLADLPLKSIDMDKRRRIGPPPMSGEPDVRKIWNPPLVFEGNKLANAEFDVFETIWPADGTDLSGKEVALYFDKEKKFPLPFWIQVETSHLIGSLRTIDSGINLPSTHRSMPRRIPQFIGLPQKTKKGLRLALKSPKYYRNFELFAIDKTTKEKQIYPIAYSLLGGNEEFLNLDIDMQELQQNLQKDHEYTFLLVPTDYQGSYTESLKSFTWIPDN